MIRKDVDLNSDTWCDLVFEGRNQEYGAYNLRRTSAKRHLIALFIVLAVVIILILSLYVIHFNSKQETTEYELAPIELSSFVNFEEIYEKQQVKAEEKPQLKEIPKFTPPIIAEDENITEEAKKELQETPPVVTDSIDTLLDRKENALLHQEIAELNLADEDTAFVFVDKNAKPEFADEKSALLRYIYQNTHYPQAALMQRITGRVVCSFIINENGSISDITLIQSAYSFLDDEVLRVIRSIPSWKPVMQNGKAIKVKCIAPVVFKL